MTWEHISKIYETAFKNMPFDWLPYMSQNYSICVEIDISLMVSKIYKALGFQDKLNILCCKFNQKKHILCFIVILFFIIFMYLWMYKLIPSWNSFFLSNHVRYVINSYLCILFTFISNRNVFELNWKKVICLGKLCFSC